VHVKEHDLDEAFQSAYKKNHSTETALIRVQNDILRANDDQNVCLLLLLDLSAAFDTIDHEIMMTRLSDEFGICGTAFDWFRSYLSGRMQCVTIGEGKSEPILLKYGVPQGSVAGPELFTRYAAPVARIISKYGLAYHIYADDTQIYVFFRVKNSKQALDCVEKCVTEIRTWMRVNKLQLNDGKTEVILIGSNQNLKQLPANLSLQVGETAVAPSTAVRNIGAIFDKNMTMEKHINTVCKAANFHIRNIGKIRKYLTRHATEQLVHAFVTSKLDYANALLVGVARKQLQKLQRVQNTAARVITRTAKYENITPVLQQLHWLPVKHRITFKILLVTYKALHGNAPGYIRELLTVYEPSRSLRSQDKQLLVEPKTRLKTFGDRAFSSIAPRLWNQLPLEVKNSTSTEAFKSSLKRHLFKIAFD
jgi:hypothetical protein